MKKYVSHLSYSRNCKNKAEEAAYIQFPATTHFFDNKRE